MLMPLRGVHTSPDSAWYLATALNLAERGQYLDSRLEPATARGPIFPLLLALSFKLSGISVESAFWMARLFSVLNGLLVYALAARLFGRSVGLTAALLALSSLTVQSWSARILLDHVQPSFLLATLLLLYLAFERKLLRFFVGTGVALGMAILTKASAALFLPLPLLLWLSVSTYRSRGSFAGLVSLYLASAVLVAPWLLYTTMHRVGGDPVVARSAIVVKALTENGGSEDDSSTFGAPPGWWGGKLYRYYLRHLGPALAFAPLVLAAWAWLAWRALVRRCRSSLLLLIALGVLGPLVLYLGSSELRHGQSLMVYLLSYIALAVLLVPGSLSRGRGPVAARWILLGLYFTLHLGSGAVGLRSLFEPHPDTGYVIGHGIYGSALSGRSWRVSGWHDQPVREAAAWFLDNSGADQPILMDWYWADSLFFYLRGRQPVHSIHHVHSQDLAHSFMAARQPADLAPPGAPVFLWIQGGRADPSSPDAVVSGLSEALFLRQVETLGAEFVVVTPLHHFLYFYLKASPGFQEIEQLGGGEIMIFRVAQPGPRLLSRTGASAVPEIASPVSFPRVASTVPHYLELLRRREPQRFADLEKSFLGAKLALAPADIAALVAGRYPIIELRRLYTIEDYARAVRERGARAVAREVERLRRQAARAPADTWTLVTLAHLHLASHDFEQAAAMLIEAGDRRPGGAARRALASAWAALGHRRLAKSDGGAAAALQNALEIGSGDSEVRRAVLSGALQLFRGPDRRSGRQLLADYEHHVRQLAEERSALLDLAELYVALGRTAEALALYDSAVGRWPGEGRPRLQRARLLKAQGKEEAAILDYERAVELMPAAGAVYRELVDLYLARDRVGDAVGLYRRAAARLPHLAWPHVELGQLFLRIAAEES